jgi:hypothetical protein
MGGSGSADDKAIAKGVEVWNEKSPAAAKAYWNGIKDKEINSKYMGYLDTYNNGAKILSDTAALKATDQAKLLAACKNSIRTFSALDKSLMLPSDVRKAGLALTEGRVRALIVANEISEARALSSSAVKVYGESEALEAMNKELDVILASRAREAEAGVITQKAHASQAYEEKLVAFEASIAAYQKAESALASDAAKAGVAKNAGIITETKGLKKKRQDVNVERETLLRERAYYYKNRIGEEFARVPEKGKTGSMTLDEILKHQESVKINVDTAYKEMVTFAGRYPDVIGQDILDEIADQKKDLDVKIVQVNNEIRTAREIASRGKVAMPVMIGLFNPQPGTAEESKKSRPAQFSAKAAKKPEYWWGMISIPGNEMNDLVITMKDNRPVRVFPENTKSGTLIEKNKLPDLVNRTYKIGNSWPVLNAGSQLTSDKYFFEVQPGKTAEYEGEVVVYSSFIVRMR